MQIYANSKPASLMHFMTAAFVFGLWSQLSLTTYVVNSISVLDTITMSFRQIVMHSVLFKPVYKFVSVTNNVQFYF